MENNKINEKIDPVIEKRKSMTKTANDLAGVKGHKDAKSFMEDTKAKLESTNKAVKQKAVSDAREFTKDLLLLVLYQDIDKMSDLGYVSDFANKFDDGEISEGNAKQYIANKLTGNDTYLSNEFVPAKKSKKSVETHVIQMYTKDNSTGDISLHPKAYQFKKPLTLQEPEWLPYFKSGALGEFIAELQRQLATVYNIYKFNKIANLIKTQTFNKSITGTGKDLFECLSDEILPAIRKMTTLNSEYNVNAKSKYVHNTKIEDLIVIMSPANIQRIQSGIKSQLFNAKFLDIGTLLNENNIINLGNEINIGDSDTEISIGAAEYVDDNTVYVLSKKAIRHVSQISRQESQAWAENLSIQLTLHVWGAVDFLPWGQGFKYTNPNLSKLPAGGLN